MRFVVDSSWTRVGPDGATIVAGSPIKVFRLSPAGTRVARQIEDSADVAASTLIDRLLDAGAIHPSPGSGTIGTDRVTVVTPQFGGEVTDDGRITVDDASADPLVGATLRLDRNRGPAAARNAGRQLAANDFIAFVDADVRFPSIDRASVDTGGWWDRLLAHFDDPLVGLVAPRVTGDSGSSLDLGGEPARIRAGTRVSYVPAAMVVVRATAFDDVGGFDERLRFGEDVDFVWRLDQAGWRCRYEPTSVVRHRRRPTMRARLRQQVGYGSSSGPLALRHPAALAPYRSNPWSLAVAVLTLSGRPVAGAILGLGSAVALAARLPGVPPTAALRLGVLGHVRSGEQLARAGRRAWWPILAVAAIASRRARIVLAMSFAASPRSALRDVAFGWGMWRSMWRHRTWAPIRPDIVGAGLGRRS